MNRLERLANDWGEVRDDLIRQNLDRELQRMKRQGKMAEGTILLQRNVWTDLDRAVMYGKSLVA